MNRKVESMSRRKKIRLRFRKIVRLVAYNKVWLSDLDDTKVSTNFKRNVAMLVRRETKIGLLTMAEKVLIRLPPFMRTVEDRKKLVNLMLNLDCFSQFPPKVRARLSKVVNFMYLTPNRFIIREGSTPYAIYFILTGEAEVTRRAFDLNANAYIDKLVHISGPGDILGEIEATYRCKRTFTTRSASKSQGRMA